jgi:hypothetical protein
MGGVLDREFVIRLVFASAGHVQVCMPWSPEDPGFAHKYTCWLSEQGLVSGVLAHR